MEVIRHAAGLFSPICDAHAPPVFAGRVDDSNARAGATYEKLPPSCRPSFQVRKTAPPASRAARQAQKHAAGSALRDTTVNPSPATASPRRRVEILRVIRQLNETTALEFVPRSSAHLFPEDFAPAGAYVDCG